MRSSDSCSAICGILLSAQLFGGGRAAREPFHLRHMWGSARTAGGVPAAED